MLAANALTEPNAFALTLLVWKKGRELNGWFFWSNLVTVAFTLSDASWASVPVLSPVRLGCFGSIAAFITTLKVALILRFSMKLPVLSDGFRCG